MACPDWLNKSFPFAFLALGVAGALNLGHGLPDNGPLLIVMALVNVLAFFACLQWGAVVPYLLGSTGGVTMWYFLSVLLMQVDLDYQFYTLLVPFYIGLLNAVGYKLELATKIEGIRWLFCTFVGFAINIFAGFMSGYLANYEGMDMFVYIATSMSIYFWISFGMLRGLDSLGLQVASDDKPAAPREVQPPTSFQQLRQAEVDDSAEKITIQLPSKAFWFRAFNALFIFAFAAGWSITMYAHPEFIEDNPIKRAFWANNICIGVDYGPARVVANWLWGLMLLPMGFFVGSSYLHMVQTGMSKGVVRFNVALMAVGYFFAMSFGLAFGIQPETHDPKTVYIHTWGFTLGLLGYALTRLSEVISYWNQYPRPWPAGGTTYVVLLSFYFIWAVVGLYPLIRTLLVDPIPLYLSKPPGYFGVLPGNQIAMWVWTIGILALPIITEMCTPEITNRLYVTTDSSLVKDVMDWQELMWSDVSPVKCCIDKILNFSWVWYIIFVVVFTSPINTNISHVIDPTGGWRLAVYLGGVTMAFSYLASGIVLTVSRPFSNLSFSDALKDLCNGKATLGDKLQGYVYLMLLPVGGGMGGFHIYMLIRRMSGCTMGNAHNIGGCVFMQAMWLGTWYVWYAKARRFQQLGNPNTGLIATDPDDGPTPKLDDAAQKSIDTGLTLGMIGTSLIIASMVLRFGFFIASHGDVLWFDETYTGGHWDEIGTCDA